MILSLSCSFVPLLINIRNKKMQSRSHPVSSTLELSREPPSLPLNHSPTFPTFPTSLPSHLSYLANSSLPPRPRSAAFPNLPCHYPCSFTTLPELLTTPLFPPFPTYHLTTLAPFPPCQLSTTPPLPPLQPFPPRQLLTTSPLPLPPPLSSPLLSPLPPFPTLYVTALQLLQFAV